MYIKAINNLVPVSHSLIRGILSSCHAAGEVDGEHHIGFISPLHRRFCAQHHGEAVAGV